ncbi:Uncharacterised protein [Serratia marcescens]|nr:Uncharacterised protein [Serratia marcescens]
MAYNKRYLIWDIVLVISVLILSAISLVLFFTG